MSDHADIRRALVWCLRHGVKAVDFGATGYWDQSGYDGSEIMPPAHLHVELDAARAVALALPEGTIVNVREPPADMDELKKRMAKDWAQGELMGTQSTSGAKHGD